MALLIGTKHDLKALEDDLGLVAAETMSAHARAANRALGSTRKVAAQEFATALPGLKASVLKSRMKLERATRRAGGGALVFSSGRFRLFGHFALRQTPQGVPLRRLPWRIETVDGEPVTPAALAHAFIQRPRHGGLPAVLVRVGRRRYPIVGLYVPSLAALLVARNLLGTVRSYARERYLVVLEQEAQYRILTRQPARLDDGS